LYTEPAFFRNTRRFNFSRNKGDFHDLLNSKLGKVDKHFGPQERIFRSAHHERDAEVKLTILDYIR
jgi:hypothetical protein